MSDSRVSDQPAFILHRRDFRDSSLILDVFSRAYGRLGVIAKGARKRRDASVFQPFKRLSISWTGSGELKTLTAIEAAPFSVKPDCYLAAYYVNELILYLLQPQDPHEEIFDACQRLLLVMDNDNMHAELRDFEMELLSSLGLMPDLSQLGHDGDAINPGKFYRVDAEQGVVHSEKDDSEAIAGELLLAVHSRRFDDLEVRRVARKVLAKIIDFHLHGRTLQSRKLYLQMHINRSP